MPLQGVITGIWGVTQLYRNVRRGKKDSLDWVFNKFQVL